MSENTQNQTFTLSLKSSLCSTTCHITKTPGEAKPTAFFDSQSLILSPVDKCSSTFSLHRPDCSTTSLFCTCAWYAPLHWWKVGLNTLFTGSTLTYDTRNRCEPGQHPRKADVTTPCYFFHISWFVSILSYYDSLLWFGYEMSSQKIHMLKAQSGDGIQRGLDHEDANLINGLTEGFIRVSPSLSTFQLPEVSSSDAFLPGYSLMFCLNLGPKIMGMQP